MKSAHNIKLLDCTLREAPVSNIKDRIIFHFIEMLENANIDIIECAFLSNLYKYSGNSTHFTAFKQIEKFLTNKRNDICYTVCFNQNEYDVHDLPEYNSKSIDGIRFVLKKGELDSAIPALNEIKNKGYKVFVQNRDTISYNANELLNVLEKINILKPYSYSIVDTYGSTYMDDLRSILDIVLLNLDCEINLGFHSHNNLLLASANAQEFIRLASDTRNVFIDGSILGCGIGAGNANTEVLAEFLNNKYNAHYNIDVLFDIIDNLMPNIQRNCNWGYNIPNFISGITGTVTTHADYISRTFKSMPSKELFNLIKTMDQNKRKIVDFDFDKKYYFEYYQINDYKITRNDKLRIKFEYFLFSVKLQIKIYLPLIYKILVRIFILTKRMGR
jgi:4-hydroxy 2-oxovalerate aldolase